MNPINELIEDGNPPKPKLDFKNWLHSKKSLKDILFLSDILNTVWKQTES